MITNLVAVLLVLALLALIARGRTSVSWPFTWHLGLCLLAEQLMRWWPDTFYTQTFWWCKEGILAGLTLVILLQLARAACDSMPGARGIAMPAIVSICAATAGAAWSSGTYDALAAVQAGTVWGFAALLAVTLWFRLPLHPLHRAIMLGFTLYLGVYGPVLGLVRYLSEGALNYLWAVDAAAYAATLLLWIHAAGRPYAGEPTWPVPPWLARRLA